jgi:hypothetical protein
MATSAAIATKKFRRYEGVMMVLFFMVLLCPAGIRAGMLLAGPAVKIAIPEWAKNGMGSRTLVQIFSTNSISGLS